MKNIKLYLSILSTIIVGALFVLSAVLKMQSLDAFELYIFSFELFSLNLSSVLARLIVGVELCLGLAYLLNIYHRKVYYLIFASLVLFTLFLVVVTFIGREDNCHCFGSLVNISPTESIFKNLAMLVVLLLSRTLPSWTNAKVLQLQSYALLTICAMGFYPMMKYPPRALTSLKSRSASVGSVNVDLFNEFISQNQRIEWGTRTKAIFFYGIGCKYCEYSASQLSYIVRRNKLSTKSIQLVFFGTQDDVMKFYEDTNSVFFDFAMISPKFLLDITGGRMPTMILYEPDTEAGFITSDIKTIDESKFVKLVKGE